LKLGVGKSRKSWVETKVGDWGSLREGEWYEKRVGGQGNSLFVARAHLRLQETASPDNL
jgi:hypothetical protein